MDEIEQGTFKHRRAMRSPPRSPGRLREDDAAAHAARVAEARAAYSRLSRAGGELNRELRPAARKSAPATYANARGAPAEHEDALRGLDSLAVAAGRRAPPRKPPPSSPPGDISAGPHEGWLGSVLARREEEEEEDDDDDDDDDVELTEEEVRAFREYRQTEELHARLGFALTDKALSPMRGEAPERRKNPNPSSSSPNSTPGKKKKSSPAAEADRAARAARAVLADMAAANKSLMDAAVASPDAFRLTHERTRRVMRDIGLAETDKAADEIIELTSASASIARQKKGGAEGGAEGKGGGRDEGGEDEDEDGDPVWYDEDDPAWSMDVEAKLAAIAAAREEANVRRVRLERLMGDAEARMGTRKPPGGTNVDEKIAALKKAALAREREFEKLGIGGARSGAGEHGETAGETAGESRASFSRADADASIARLEKAVAEFKALGPLTPGPMTPQTKAEIEAEVTARLPKFPPGTPPLPEFDYDPREVDELLTQLEAEEAERAAAKKKGEGEQKQQQNQQQHHHHQQQQQQQQQQRSPISPRSPSRGARPPLPPDVSAHRTALVLEALAEADLEVRDPEVEGSNPAWVDARDPATPNALKPAEDDSIGKEHTRATDGATTDRTPRGFERTDASPGDEAIDAKIAELRETMRGCAELIARHARDDPTKTKLVRDLAHVLNAASEKESRVETERAKGGDETGEGDEPATSESLLESLPEWAGQVPDAIRETRELIRDMEERVKATAARLHDSLTKPPRPFEISADGETGEGERDGQPALTVEGMLKGLDRLNAERLDHRPFASALANAFDADSDAEDSPGLSPRWGGNARNNTNTVDDPSPSEWDREAWERERAALRDRLRTELGLSDRFGEDEPPVPVPEMTWHKHAGVDGEEERFLPEDETGKLKHVRDFQSLMDYAFD